MLRVLSRQSRCMHTHLQRRVNLGSTVDFLREYVPHALAQLPDKARLSPEITLRVAPSVHHNVPMIKGHVSYATSIKAVQLVLSTFVLRPHTQLHITDLEVDEDGKSSYGAMPGSAKVIVKWCTCSPDCHHLSSHANANGNGNGNGNANTTAHTPVPPPSAFDLTKLFAPIFGSQTPPEQLGTNIMFGIFAFELNKDCDLIVVHSLENLEMLSKEDFNVGNLAPSA